jgi:hypothetical protein
LGIAQLHLAWLSLVDEAAQLLGIYSRHLRGEVVAYAPSKRRHFAYSPTGIRDMIAAKRWLPLAQRLSQDRAPVPLAFAPEPVSAAAFVSCIDRLEREHFEMIMVNPQGAVMCYRLKVGEHADINDDSDVEVHVDESDFSSCHSSDG